MQRPSLALAQAIEQSFDIALSSIGQPAASELHGMEGQLASASASTHGRSLAELKGEQAWEGALQKQGAPSMPTGWERVAGIGRQPRTTALASVQHAPPAMTAQLAVREGRTAAVPADLLETGNPSAARRSLLGATRDDKEPGRGLHLHFDIAIHVRTYSR